MPPVKPEDDYEYVKDPASHRIAALSWHEHHCIAQKGTVIEHRHVFHGRVLVVGPRSCSIALHLSIACRVVLRQSSTSYQTCFSRCCTLGGSL